ncbi:120_t:CDS:1, partial [Funneliformis geosporum]
MKQDTLKSFFSKYGNIINVKMQTQGLWQHAYITYEKPQDIA